jgi:hypothetical protein
MQMGRVERWHGQHRATFRGELVDVQLPMKPWHFMKPTYGVARFMDPAALFEGLVNA